MADFDRPGRHKMQELGLLFRGKVFFQRPHLGEQLIGPERFGLVDFADRKTNVHHDIVTRIRFGNEIQPHFPDDATELHSSGARQTEISAA
jgi:hypothetical protein